MSSIQIHSDYRYVAAAILSTTMVLVGQSVTVLRYRKRAGIRYPQLYAEQAQADNNQDAFLFNCAQRAHQNTLENIPNVWAATAIVGLQRPILAAALCALWSLSRIPYTIGYLSGDPEKRVTLLHSAGILGAIGLMLTATTYAAGWIWEGISTNLSV